MAPVHVAAATSNLGRLRAALDSGDAVDSLNPDQATPLMYGAFAGSVDVVAELIQRGADVRAVDQARVWVGAVPRRWCDWQTLTAFCLPCCRRGPRRCTTAPTRAALMWHASCCRRAPTRARRTTCVVVLRLHVFPSLGATHARPCTLRRPPRCLTHTGWADALRRGVQEGRPADRTADAPAPARRRHPRRRPGAPTPGRPGGAEGSRWRRNPGVRTQCARSYRTACGHSVDITHCDISAARPRFW